MYIHTYDITDDAARLSSSVKGEIPGKGKEMKTEAKLLGEEAGAKIDDAVSNPSYQGALTRTTQLTAAY